MKKRLVLGLAMIMAVGTISACGGAKVDQEATPTPVEATNGDVDEAAEVITTTEVVFDRAGNEIALPENIEKVMIAGPSNAEILSGLGLGDKIIAADMYSQGTEGLGDEVIFFDMMDPDVEQIISLKPDVLLATGMVQDGDDVYNQLINAGICVIFIPSSTSIQGIEEDIQYIADVMGVSEQGTKVVEEMQSKIDAISEIGKSITDKKSVYFEIAAAPDMYSFGNGVFLNEMIEIIGATNIFAGQESWIAVTDESILAANPDVILTSVNYIENPTDEIKFRAGWEVITAIKDGAIYSIDANASNQPSQNIVKALEEMAKAVYPVEY